MFKIALVLSTTPSTNIFRHALTSAFDSGYLDQFLICSGFFHQRNNGKGPFYASDAFKSAKLPNRASVTVVGAYDPASSEFDDFFKTLKSKLKTKSGSKVPVSQRRANKKYANKWHAKIFLARQQNKYRFAVIGSSNLTRSAFSTTASNNEADVIIWDDSHRSTKNLVNSLLQNEGALESEDGPGLSIFVSNYNQSDVRNSSLGPMQDRLKQLWKDVLSATSA